MVCGCVPTLVGIAGVRNTGSFRLPMGFTMEGILAMSL